MHWMRAKIYPVTISRQREMNDRPKLQHGPFQAPAVTSINGRSGENELIPAKYGTLVFFDRWKSLCILPATIESAETAQ